MLQASSLSKWHFQNIYLPEPNEYIVMLDDLLNKSKYLKKWWKFRDISMITGIKHIVFVWSSLCWKSTILDSIRSSISNQSVIGKRVCVYLPTRIVDRPERENHDINQAKIEWQENMYVTSEEYNKLLQKGEIWLNWERNLAWETKKYWFKSLSSISISQVNDYNTFKALDQDLPTLPIRIEDPRSLVLYSWNNAFYDNNSTINWIDEIDIKNILVIWVYASDNIRSKRLIKRNPNMNWYEAKARLWDFAWNVIPNCHVYIDTSEGWDIPNIEAIQLIEIIAKANLWSERIACSNNWVQNFRDKISKIL